MTTKALWQTIAAMVVLVLVALAGYVIGTSGSHDAVQAQTPTQRAGGPPNVSTSPQRQPLYWYDPMYPQHKFDKPGKSPYMDMQLVPKYADDAAGGVRIDPSLSQSLGMRVAPVERATVNTGVTAVASVGFNERDVAIVQARTGGFVERAYARAPGDVIHADAPLADVLVTEWAGAQQEYLAVRAIGDAELTAAARERLLLLGMTAAQIAGIERSGEPRAVMTIRAPIGGVIEELGVRTGMSVTPGMTLARINGLRSVWLEAAVPEAQATLLLPERAVEARFAAYPGEVFKGKIAAILPEANVETRTLRVRMEFPNRKQRLRAGMFAQVQISGTAQHALVVPSEAVIRTGKRSVVFVSDEPGRFQPVEVQVGHEMDGKLTVLSGLQEGQQVAVSGQFLIDSEASFQGFTDRMAADQDAGTTSPLSDAASAMHEGTGTITALSDGEVTLSHGPIPTLQWGAMTMPFKLPEGAAAQGLKAGDSVQFSFRQRDGDFVIERLEKSGGKP
jgi:Cu(I)/Ag(I) efflux system membrane fusion protein